MSSTSSFPPLSQRERSSIHCRTRLIRRRRPRVTATATAPSSTLWPANDAVVPLAVVEVRPTTRFVPPSFPPSSYCATTANKTTVSTSADTTAAPDPSTATPPPPLTAPLVKWDLLRTSAVPGKLWIEWADECGCDDESEGDGKTENDLLGGEGEHDEPDDAREAFAASSSARLVIRSGAVSDCDDCGSNAVVLLPSDDPLIAEPVPCDVTGYAPFYDTAADIGMNDACLRSRRYNKPRGRRQRRTLCAVTDATLVRILPPCRRHHRLRGGSSSSSGDGPRWLLDALSGEDPDDTGGECGDCPNDDDAVLSCHDASTVRALAVRMNALLSRPVKVGTTEDAFRMERMEKEGGQRVRDGLKHFWDARRQSKNDGRGVEAVGGNEDESLAVFGGDVDLSPGHRPPPAAAHEEDDDSISFTPSSFREGGLVVHDPHRGSGKTVLVRAVAREILRCDAVHVLSAPVLFATYGANHADAALETILHGIAVGGALRWTAARQVWDKRAAGEDDDDGKGSNGGKGGLGGGGVGGVCIVLDGLDAFLPPRMSGKGSGAGDPALPALNAMAAYLSQLASSLKRNGAFPFPAKNPLYNLQGTRGHVLPVRLCVVGIITIDDDGGKKRSAAATVGSGSASVLDVLGGGRYRVPDPSAAARLSAFRRAFEAEGVVLDEAAEASLPLLTASAVSARGGDFRWVARTLRTLRSSGAMAAGKDGETGVAKEEVGQRSPTVFASSIDVRRALRSLRDGTSGSPFGCEVSFFSDGINKETAASSGLQTLQGAKDAFESVGGNTEAKVALEDALALDPEKRRVLAAFGLSPPTGVLLYGPPGTGKTLLARAMARALQSQNNGSTNGGVGGAFVSLRASDIVRSEVGNSEKLLVTAFQSARANAPSVVFIDEFQALFSDRGGGGGGSGSGRLVSTLLQCMDDVTRWRDADSTALVEDNDIQRSRVVVLGATNAPWMVDKAFIRPGRFDRVVHVGLPTCLERESILRVHVGRMKLQRFDGVSPMDRICKRMAVACDGFSGADLSALCRAAAVRCLGDEDGKEGVLEQHFLDALDNDVGRSSSNELVKRLVDWSPMSVKSK